MKLKLLNYILDNKIFEKNSKILLAISGGIDSVCLAHLLIDLKFQVEFAHCNFNLRNEESTKDSEFVEKLAKQLNVPFHGSSFDTEQHAKKNKLSLQMAARELRYSWFDKLRLNIKADYIAVAHNLDDKVETFFLNIIRGTGIRGMISMKNKNGVIVRPLLFAKRSEIKKYVLKNNFQYREDSSNSSVKYKRNKIRHELIPVLKEINPAILETVDKDIRLMRKTFFAYENYIHLIEKQIVFPFDGGLKVSKKDFLKLSDKEAIIYEIFSKYGFKDFTSILQSIENTIGKQFFSSTHKLLIDRDYIIMKSIQDDYFKPVLIDEKIKFLKNPIFLSFDLLDLDESLISSFSACFDFNKLQFPLSIRKWKDGDKFKPLGMNRYKKLSDFFIDLKLDMFSKQETFLLCSGNDIIWVIGHRIDERFKVTSKTKKMYIANLLEK
tara:strand:- start:5447 stop:6760 length:1314 start_codon:yes stop_codon:yes gene_type:complete